MSRPSATTRRTGDASKSTPSEDSPSRASRETSAKRYGNSPRSWLRTGESRLEAVPASLLPWTGPESRQTYKKHSGSDAPPVVQARVRR